MNKIWLCFEQCTEAICISLPVGRWFHPDLWEIIWVFLIHYFSTQYNMEWSTYMSLFKNIQVSWCFWYDSFYNGNRVDIYL